MWKEGLLRSAWVEVWQFGKAGRGCRPVLYGGPAGMHVEVQPCPEDWILANRKPLGSGPIAALLSSTGTKEQEHFTFPVSHM